MRRIVVYRIVLAVLVGGSMIIVGHTVATSPLLNQTTLEKQSKLPLAERQQIVEPRDGITVVAKGLLRVRTRSLVAFGPDGRLIYREVGDIGDVDPSPVGDHTILYAKSLKLSQQECSSTTSCTRNIIKRTNLTTRESEIIYSHVEPGWKSKRWHDVDRINATHFVVADIARDRVFIVNVTSSIITWEWDAQSHYPIRSGGSYPEDWTHLNDVENLDDGRLMVSLRNQDQVLFLDRSRGVIEDLSLGETDNRSILYEQHNPDYIPSERGGPAVLVANSERNRVEEFQRQNGTWTRTWVWTDRRMLWPRDADRLPDGHTLITDSNGGRILEVDESGSVVWKVPRGLIGIPYEAERLNTGDESTNGSSAVQLSLESNRARTSDADDSPSLLYIFGKSVLPDGLINVIAFVAPTWMTALDVMALTTILFGGPAWVVLELQYRFRVRIEIRSPIKFHSRGGD